MSSFIEYAAQMKAKKKLGHVDLPQWSSFDLQEMRKSLREKLAHAIYEADCKKTTSKVEIELQIPSALEDIQVPEAYNVQSKPIFSVPSFVRHEVEALVRRELKEEGFQVGEGTQSICAYLSWSEETKKQLEKDARQKINSFVRRGILMAILLVLLPICLPLSLYLTFSVEFSEVLFVLLLMATPFWTGFVITMQLERWDHRVNELSKNIIARRPSVVAKVVACIPSVDVREFQKKAKRRAQELLDDGVTRGALDVSREVEEEWQALVRTSG